VSPDAAFVRVDAPTRAALVRFRREHPPGRLTVDGVVWEYLVAGDASATILFLHGMAGAADIWWQQLGALSDRFRTVAVTYPAVTSLAALGRGVAAVLDHLDVARTALVGSSLGGYLAQYLVATMPGRVDAAVFANTFPPNDLIERRSRTSIAVARLLPAPLLMRSLRRSVERRLVPAGDGSPLLRAMLLEQFAGALSKDRFLARYRCVVDRFAAPQPSLPVLLVESDNDPLVAPDLRALLRITYRDAPLHTFSGGGHFPYVNRPDPYPAVLRDFLG